MSNGMSSLTFSTQFRPVSSVKIVFTTYKNVLLEKMLAATQGLLWLVLVAARKKNKAGFEWDLTLIGEESSGVVKFKVGAKCSYAPTKV